MWSLQTNYQLLCALRELLSSHLPVQRESIVPVEKYLADKESQNNCIYGREEPKVFLQQKQEKKAR